MYNNKIKENEQIEKRSFYSNKKLVENRGIERNSSLFGMNTRDDNVFKNKENFDKKTFELSQFNKIDFCWRMLIFSFILFDLFLGF